MLRYCLTALALTAAAAVAFADDFAPAPWRGQPLTVAAEWEFISSNMGDLPPEYLVWVDDGIHPYNDCFEHTHYQNGVYWEADPSEPGDGRAVTGAVPGQLLFFLCNFIDDFQHKYVWVQITFGGQGVPFVYEVVAPNEQTNEWTDPVYGNLIESSHAGGHAVDFWHLPYNPDREFVNVEIPPFTWIDQIWIETISIDGPIADEPSTWGDVKSLFR